jgi:hypothetical protein
MKKSFRPTSRPSPRPASRPSIRPSAPHVSSSHGSMNAAGQSHVTKKEPDFGSQNAGMDGKKFAGGAQNDNFYKKGPGFNQSGNRWGGRRTAPIIGIVAVVICCLIVLCLALVYAVTQGLINIPSF